jgi:HPr kinase/phosphorylase
MAATIHAGALIVGAQGVLIRGPSGSGKSSLLLAILSANPRTSWLTADDCVLLAATHGRLIAAVPDSIAGLLEIRGQGIVRRRHVSPARIHFVVDLTPSEQCPRLPLPEAERVSIEGVQLPCLTLPIAVADGAIRVRSALERLKH